MRAAAIQINSTEDKARNMETADRLTRAAAADGADLIVLPEKFNVLGTHEDYLAGAETLEGPTIAWARAAAKELGLDLVAGSIVERREGREKLGNTSVHVGPDGEIKGIYRKIHMFDVVVGGIEYRESASEEPGGEIVTSEAGGVPLGLAVCYDLRFPELFRILAIKGARVIALPAAFTKVTGQAHWEILVRARAIENQAFFVAADQIGTHPPDKESFGGSMIVDPWGEVLARAPDIGDRAQPAEPAASQIGDRAQPAEPAASQQECFVAANLDFAKQDEVRDKLPALANRMPATYIWPEGMPA